MVRVLAVADEVCDALWGAKAAALAPDVVLAAGDLPWDYLEFLASVTDRPVVFVPGNHDPAVASALQRRLPGPVDVLLTHAPPRGLGDEDDRPHVGIDALHPLLERLHPRWHLHGHIHAYGQPRPDRRVGDTTIRNVIPYRMVEIPHVRDPGPEEGPR